RGRGSCNYKQAILLKVIDAILPGGQVAWLKVAERYHVLSGELLAHQPEDVEKCCGKGKKPTGTSGPSPTIEEAQRIYRKILSKNSMRDHGGGGSGSSTSGSGSDTEGDLPNLEPLLVTSRGIPLVDPGFAQGEPLLARQQTDPVAPVELGPPMVAMGLPSRKRKHDDNKSKNSRPSNPRWSAAAGINGLVSVMISRMNTPAPAAGPASVGFEALMQTQVNMMQMMMQQQMFMQQRTWHKCQCPP
ncbi:hypothetical protein B484DRAFT_468909, partial [Ochromonadaceae sp. CCMP2298]